MIREMISNGQSRSRKLRYRATVGYSVARGIVFTKSTFRVASGKIVFLGYSLQWTTPGCRRQRPRRSCFYSIRETPGIALWAPIDKLDESSLCRSFGNALSRGYDATRTLETVRRKCRATSPWGPKRRHFGYRQIDVRVLWAGGR